MIQIRRRVVDDFDKPAEPGLRPTKQEPTHDRPVDGVGPANRVECAEGPEGVACIGHLVWSACKTGCSWLLRREKLGDRVFALFIIFTIIILRFGEKCCLAVRQPPDEPIDIDPTPVPPCRG